LTNDVVHAVLRHRSGADFYAQRYEPLDLPVDKEEN
jgi:hypothetical protein